MGEEVGDAVVECVRALLGDGVVLQDADELNRLPTQQALQDINQTVLHLGIAFLILRLRSRLNS